MITTWLTSLEICNQNEFMIIDDIYVSTLLSYIGGLAEEVDEKVLHAAFIPFGEIIDVQIPLDYESEKHRGFAFIEFETAEDAAAAIDNMVRLYIMVDL